MPGPIFIFSFSTFFQYFTPERLVIRENFSSVVLALL